MSTPTSMIALLSRPIACRFDRVLRYFVFFSFSKKSSTSKRAASLPQKKFKIGRKFLLYFFFFVCVTFCGAVYFSLFSRKRSHALLRFVAEKPSKTQYNPVKPQYNLVKPSTTQYNPVKPSKTQYNPVKPSKTQ